MPSLPSISFIVPLYNHLEHTRAMLDSLLASLPAGLDFEVVLVDDGSSDGTRDWLSTLDHPRIRTLLNPENLGYARSNNAGVRLACGELLGLLNNDLLFEPGWFEPMIDALLSPGLRAGVVGNLQVRMADGALDHAGVELTPRGQFDHLRVLPAGQGSPQRSLAVTGACMLLRRADFDAVGGFDAAYVNGCEDIDLCLKLAAMGRQSWVATASRIRHHVSLSRSRTSAQNERNSRHLFARWRREIRRELAARWSDLLRQGPDAYAAYFDGRLSPDFVATPNTAARAIAEAMLLREEFRWSRELDGVDPNAGVAQRCRVRGLGYDDGLRGWRAYGDPELIVPGLKSSRNFFVCGRRLGPAVALALAVTISVDGLHQKTVVLEPQQRNLNLGLIDPLLLQGLDARFCLDFHWQDEAGHRLGDARDAVLITHFVVDDRLVQV